MTYNPNKPAPVCAGTPTPWTDARAVQFNGLECYGNPDGDVTASADTRTLERHLRRIVECRDNLIKPDEMGTFGELMNAIRDAKETLSK